MAVLWLDQSADGWRHKIGDEPVACGTQIEVRMFGDWVSGRYEAEDLSPRAPRPTALLFYDNDKPPLRVEEFTEARFPRR